MVGRLRGLGWCGAVVVGGVAACFGQDPATIDIVTDAGAEAGGGAEGGALDATEDGSDTDGGAACVMTGAFEEPYDWTAIPGSGWGGVSSPGTAATYEIAQDAGDPSPSLRITVDAGADFYVGENKWLNRTFSGPCVQAAFSLLVENRNGLRPASLFSLVFAQLRNSRGELSFSLEPGPSLEVFERAYPAPNYAGQWIKIGSTPLKAGSWQRIAVRYGPWSRSDAGADAAPASTLSAFELTVDGVVRDLGKAPVLDFGDPTTFGLGFVFAASGIQASYLLDSAELR